ncbi:hypothetical protein [Actinoplanes couchii]|uniref:hypothetical protein n=1 Tax=Actinoplanes couchii TaxID=403638 RepID=UPI0019440904|nr:hypothetical protein [Actinoplanes couchii]MDR6326327.1 hypothetical protein [Actinoplanes couchii]
MTGSPSVFVGGSGKPRKTRRPAVALAVVFSLLALGVAAGAGFLSWRTFETVNGISPPLMVSTTPTPRVTGMLEAARQSPPPDRSRPLDPVRFPVSYAKEPLRLDLACAAVIHLDLDEPRADAPESVADLRYQGRCGAEPPKLSLGAGAAAGSRQVSADTDAAGCDRAIRTSPLGRGLQVEVRTGSALCVLTAAAPAELVLVEIIDVGGSGTAGLRATSWQVPK